MSADTTRVPVRLLSQVLGSPGGEAGEVVWLLPHIARAWVAAGLAEVFVAEDVEVAAVAAPEASVRRRGRPRRGA